MNAFYTITLLIVSNCFMTLAWYGHLKLQSIGTITDHTPLLIIIPSSWLLALPEYICQVNGNRIGFIENGGPFTLMQLKIIQEVLSIAIFTVFSVMVFKGQPIQWNHIAAFFCLILAVYFVFLK